jgi:hypothetical protein
MLVHLISGRGVSFFFFYSPGRSLIKNFDHRVTKFFEIDFAIVVLVDISKDFLPHTIKFLH